MTRLKDLMAQKAKLEHEIAAAQDEAKAKIRANFDAELAENGFSITDIYPNLSMKPSASKPSTGSKSKGVPKYKNPNGDETWTGFGRAPLWVKAHVDNGGDKEDLRIPGS